MCGIVQKILQTIFLVFFNDVLKETLEQENPEAKKVFDMRRYLDTLEAKAKTKLDYLNQLETDIGRLSNEKKNLCCAKCGNKATKMFKDEHICNGCFMIL